MINADKETWKISELTPSRKLRAGQGCQIFLGTTYQNEKK
jgi:hypothetical protein